MGLDIILKGVDLSAVAIEFLPPVTRGLRAWHILGGDAASTVKNRYSAGAGDASLIGAPVFQPGYGSNFKANSDYLQTPVPETDSMTLAIAFRVPGATAVNPTTDLSGNASRVMMMGNQQTGGVSLYVSGVGSGGLPAGIVTGGSFSNPTTPSIQLAQINVTDVTQWQFLTLKVEAQINLNIKNHTSGVTATKADTNVRVKNTATPNIKIGSSRPDFLGLHDIAFAAIANVPWTDAERDAVYASAKASLAIRGITI